MFGAPISSSLPLYKETCHGAAFASFLSISIKLTVILVLRSYALTRQTMPPFS